MKCSVCGSTNCQNDVDCVRRVNRQNQSSKCYYVSVTLGLVLMIFGIITFIFVMTRNPAAIDKSNDIIKTSTAKSIVSAQYPNAIFDEMDKNENNFKIYFDQNNILFISFALFAFIVGFLVFLIGIRLDRPSSNNITIYQTEQVDQVELQQLNQNRNSAQLRMDLSINSTPDSHCSNTQSFSTPSEDPRSLNAQSSNPKNTSFRYSKESKRSRCSSDQDQEVEEFIPKKSINPDNEKSPRRNGPEKNVSFVPPKDIESLVLFPLDYPKVTCSDEILTIVHRIVDESQLNLRTQYITLEEKYIKITHLTNTTREFFQRTDSKSFMNMLQSEIRMNMRIKPAQYFARRIILSCVIEDLMDEADFLPAIRRENGINTSRCKFENFEVLSDGFMIYFGVTPMCYQQIIDRDYLLTINQRVIRINMLQNPYPELFSDQ